MNNKISEIKIAFLGTPEFAIPSLQALTKTPWTKVLGVCTQTDKEAGRGKKVQEPPVKKLSVELGLLTLQCKRISKEKEIIQKIKDLKPDVLITCAFGQILSEEVLTIAPFGAINVHASLLPKYRGAAPINWAILNGETETGVSIMKTEIALDAGPVLLEGKCKIEENETSADLTKKLSFIGADLLICALEKIKNGDAKFIPQDNSKATKAPSLKKELGLINWNDTSKNIHNKIRGLQPWPSAYTHFQGKLVKVWESQRTGGSAKRRDGDAGTIVEISDYVKVKTGDGYLDIYKVQPENKNIICAKDWVNGARVKIGDKFE